MVESWYPDNQFFMWRESLHLAVKTVLVELSSSQFHLIWGDFASIAPEGEYIPQHFHKLVCKTVFTSHPAAGIFCIHISYSSWF